MSVSLVPCVSCLRHIRADAGACPFCDAALPEDFSARPVPGAAQRLNRAAFAVFSTTLALASCDRQSNGNTTGEGLIMQPYGAPPTPRSVPEERDSGPSPVVVATPEPTPVVTPPATPVDAGAPAPVVGDPLRNNPQQPRERPRSQTVYPEPSVPVPAYGVAPPPIGQRQLPPGK